MSTTQHTPGPWSLDPPARPIDKRHNWYVRPPLINGRAPAIAIIPNRCWDRTTEEANARLISAAPALLEALREMMLIAEYKDGSVTMEELFPNKFAAALAALEKAGAQ